MDKILGLEMKQKPYYGFPISSILLRLLFACLISLFIIFLILFQISLYLVFFVCIIIFPAFVLFCIVFFKRQFQDYRMLIIKKMIEVANLSGNEKILDLGAGAGILAIGFAKFLKNGKVYALDLYEHKYDNFKKHLINIIKINFFGNNLINAERNAKIENVENKCEFISSDISALQNYPDNFFNIILSSQSLYCIEVKKRTQTYQEINRILKKGGKIIFFESKSFFSWNICDLKNYFKNIGFSVRILKNGEYKRHCILLGIKL